MGSSRIPPEITNCFVYFLTVDHFSYYIINCYGGDSNLELAVAISQTVHELFRFNSEKSPFSLVRKIK